MFKRGLPPLAISLGLGRLLLLMTLFALGDPTTLTISKAGVTVTSSSSTTLDFPISRGGDTSYDAFVQYQTKDGTAIAGTDYTAASGSLIIPAGQSGATIPVTIAGSTTNPPDKAFHPLTFDEAIKAIINVDPEKVGITRNTGKRGGESADGIDHAPKTIRLKS